MFRAWPCCMQYMICTLWTVLEIRIKNIKFSFLGFSCFIIYSTQRLHSPTIYCDISMCSSDITHDRQRKPCNKRMCDERVTLSIRYWKCRVNFFSEIVSTRLCSKQSKLQVTCFFQKEAAGTSSGNNGINCLVCDISSYPNSYYFDFHYHYKEADICCFRLNVSLWTTKHCHYLFNEN